MCQYTPRVRVSSLLGEWRTPTRSNRSTTVLEYISKSVFEHSKPAFALDAVFARRVSLIVLCTAFHLVTTLSVGLSVTPPKIRARRRVYFGMLNEVLWSLT